jgi:hypothetical protein
MRVSVWSAAPTDFLPEQTFFFLLSQAMNVHPSAFIAKTTCSAGQDRRPADSRASFGACLGLQRSLSNAAPVRREQRRDERGHHLGPNIAQVLGQDEDSAAQLARR